MTQSVRRRGVILISNLRSAHPEYSFFAIRDSSQYAVTIILTLNGCQVPYSYSTQRFFTPLEISVEFSEIQFLDPNPHKGSILLIPISTRNNTRDRLRGGGRCLLSALLRVNNIIAEESSTDHMKSVATCPALMAGTD